MSETMSNEGASLALYRDAPAWEGAAPTMAAGKFKCKSAKAGAALLRAAAATAKAGGAVGLIGPMDGDTWHSYRVVTQSADTPPFLLEPTSGPHDLTAFRQADFAPIAEYCSASVPLSEVPPVRPGKSHAFSVEPWDGEDAEALFAQVHALSCTAFAKNAFYKPIGLEAFLEMYMPIVPLLNKELIFFARAPDGDLVGFLFGVPNYAEGPAPKAAILKTYASLAKGAGFALSSRFYDSARAAGYDTAIHALFHTSNLSALRSAMNGAHVFRHYALMGKRLD